MKFRLNVAYVIHRRGIQSLELARLNCSGIVSSPTRPNIGEEVCLSMSGGPEPDDTLKVVQIYHDLINGVMTPDIYLENRSYDVGNRMSEGLTEAEGVAMEKKWVKTYVIPALKKQGYGEFEWCKSLLSPTS